MEYSHKQHLSNSFPVNIFFQQFCSTLQSIKFPEGKNQSSLNNKNHSSRFRKDNRIFDRLSNMFSHSKKYLVRIEFERILIIDCSMSFLSSNFGKKYIDRWIRLRLLDKNTASRFVHSLYCINSKYNQYHSILCV